MNDMTVEQKLQLVRQVRSRYHENQFDMSNRERILYGKTAIAPEKALYEDSYDRGLEGRFTPQGTAQLGDAPFSFFGIRLFIAALLLTAVIVMDRNDINVAGITTEKIFQVISADYEEAIAQWVESVSR